MIQHKCFDLLTKNFSALAIQLLEKHQDKIFWWKWEHWHWLCTNPCAIDLLERNPEKIHWDYLSMNPNAIHLLERNQDKIDWNRLSGNPDAIHLLEQNQDKINWRHLSLNPSAIHLLEHNQNKIDWDYLASNPSMFELDYDFFFRRMNIIRQELMAKAWHPDRFMKWCLSIDELQDLN
jgi:hypothetical protein